MTEVKLIENHQTLHAERGAFHMTYFRGREGSSLKDLDPACLGNELKKLSADRNEHVYTRA